MLDGVDPNFLSPKASVRAASDGWGTVAIAPIGAQQPAIHRKVDGDNSRRRTSDKARNSLSERRRISSGNGPRRGRRIFVKGGGWHKTEPLSC